jgi:hypothetical protein
VDLLDQIDTNRYDAQALAEAAGRFAALDDTEQKEYLNVWDYAGLLEAEHPLTGLLPQSSSPCCVVRDLDGTLQLLWEESGTLLDWDEVEAGNSVRWPLGLAAAGRPKTDALADFAAAHYPLTDTRATNHQLGMPGRPGRERKILTDIFAAADLIIGVTAEYGIHHLLTYLGAEAGKPQLYAWGQPGYWGGGVARVIPGQTGCWYCLKRWHETGEIPPPPRDPAAPVQPRGCASPTTTGASFDLLPVVAQAARLAVQTLLRGEAEAYPDVDADVMIMSLRTQDGPLAAPNWVTYRLDRHLDCRYCRA